MEKGIMVTNNPGGNAIPVAEVSVYKVPPHSNTERSMIHIISPIVTACSWVYPQPDEADRRDPNQTTNR
jgi:hypothetical protein